MSGQAQLWMPAILALFGSLIVVSFTAWINRLSALERRIEHLEERLGLVRP
jgi:hypothetical protein